MIHNSNWTRDELILALDLFVQAGRKQLRSNDPEVVKLSAVLQSLAIHGTCKRSGNFRSPQSVSMKLGNMLSLDPTYKGAGLKQISRLDEEVWNEFVDDRERLNTLALAIVKASRILSKDLDDEYRATSSGVPEDDEFPEGRILTRLHRQRERNAAAAERKKRSVLSQTGHLSCEACDFNFETVYGESGRGFAECHHTIPISQLVESHKTQMADLAIVCANCHRMLHRSKPVRTVKQLRDIVLQNS